MPGLYSSTHLKVRIRHWRNSIQPGPILTRARSATAHAQKTVRQYAAFEKGLELFFDKFRQARAGLGFDLGEEGLELFLHRLIERRFLRPPPLVVNSDRVASRRRLQRSANARLSTAIFFITACNCAASVRRKIVSNLPSGSATRLFARILSCGLLRTHLPMPGAIVIGHHAALGPRSRVQTKRRYIGP